MDRSDYGLWILVVMNSAIFIILAFRFFEPQALRDWHSFGAFSAFLMALYVNSRTARRKGGIGEVRRCLSALRGDNGRLVAGTSSAHVRIAPLTRLT